MPNTSDKMQTVKYRCSLCLKEATREIKDEEGCYDVPKLFCDCGGKGTKGYMSEMCIINFEELDT